MLLTVAQPLEGQGGAECHPPLDPPVTVPLEGQGGQSATPDSEKFAKNREKEGKIMKNREKRGRIGKKRQKSGRFFHFAPPDRQSWL